MSTTHKHSFTFFTVSGLLLMVALLWGKNLAAQQDAQFTHYSFNTLSVNPGYAGSRDALTLTGLHRSQWLSFPGAPITQTITTHAPVFNQKLGLGASLSNDQLGPVKNAGVSVDVAYKIKIGSRGKLAFGLKAGVNLITTDFAQLETIQANDPHFNQAVQNQFMPNFGFGLYYSMPRFYAGLSVPRLLQNEVSTSTVPVPDRATAIRHYYFISGVVLDLNSSGTLKIKPTTFVRVTGGAPVVMDLTALFYYKNKMWVGPMVRTTDAFGVLAGINASKQFSIGYSFDWSYGNATGKYNGGSHELMLRYDFIFKDKLKIESPRYF